MGPFPVALMLAGFIPEPTITEVQVYVVAAMEEVGRKFSAVEEHISTDNWEELFVMTGLGEIVTTTSMKFPTHPFAEGTIR